MPRNIEYQLERYLKEENVLKFFLLCATDLNLYQPKNIRDKYDFHYGDVDFYYEQERNAFIERIEAKKHLLDDKDALRKNAEERYKYQKKHYLTVLQHRKEEDEKLERMQVRINELAPKNEMQRLFLSALQNYFEKYKYNVIESRKHEMQEPIMGNVEEICAELAKEIEEAQATITELEFSKQFHPNQTFWDEIDEEWLSKMNNIQKSENDR